MSTTKGSVPDQLFPYSDHEALTADLRLETLIPPETGRDQQSKDQESAAGIFTSHASRVVLGMPVSLEKLALHFGPNIPTVI